MKTNLENQTKEKCEELREPYNIHFLKETPRFLIYSLIRTDGTDCTLIKFMRFEGENAELKEELLKDANRGRVLDPVTWKAVDALKRTYNDIRDAVIYEIGGRK